MKFINFWERKLVTISNFNKISTLLFGVVIIASFIIKTPLSNPQLNWWSSYFAKTAENISEALEEMEDSMTWFWDVWTLPKPKDPKMEKILSVINPDKNSPAYTIIKNKQYFGEYPIMQFVSLCESGRKHRKDGRLLKDGFGYSSKGAFQVLFGVHEKPMREMGLRPYNDDDYFTYVRYLFEKNGTKDWRMSKHCWGEYEAKYG